MGKSIKKLAEIGQRFLVFLVEEVHLYAYLLIFLIVVFGFGVLYTILTPIGQGIGYNSIPIRGVTIGKGIYFSVVTISSLGYGDMHPMGISKVFVSIEVLLGLAMIGIMIAKVTSRRLSYYVLRLFSSDAQKRLEEISSQFYTSRDELTQLMTELGRLYQTTPGGTNPVNKTEILLKFQGVLIALNTRSTNFAKYLSNELQQGDYFSIAPIAAIVRIGDAIDQAFMILTQIIISLSPQARAETLSRKNRQNISEAIESQKIICRFVLTNAKDNDTKNIFIRIQETCDRFPESYYSVPEYLQPDQTLEGSDEPQDQ